MGYNWTCNICQKSNTVPLKYFCELNEMGERRDLKDRVELNYGSYDIKAGQEYCARPPMPPSYFFMIDVSKNAVESGMIQIITNVLKDSINNNLLHGDTRTQIGFLTYDSSIHIYNLKPSLKQPQMIVIPDPGDNELPTPEELLFNI